MSAAQSATADADGAHGLAGLVAALAGGRRGNSNPRRPASRLRRRSGRTGEAQQPEPSADAAGASAQPPADGRTPAGASSAPASGPGRGSSGSGRARPTSRGTDAARDRRRDVEAELIGLRTAPGPAPSWWEPCWDKGLDDRLPPDRLFDALAGFHPGVRVLHGLSVAGTTTLIDHVLVGSGGVVVAGTESSTGRVKTDGVHLRVKGRDRSPIIDVALWQAEVIRSTLETRGIFNVPIHGVLHWQHLEGLGDRAICLRGVPLLSAGATMGLAASGLEVSPLAVERIVAALEPAAQHH